MNKEDMIKYAMMAVAGYLLWQWLTKPGGLLAAQLPAATGNGAGAGTTDGSDSAGSGKVVSKTPTTSAPTPTNEQIYAASLTSANAGKTGAWRQSPHAWNWYRAAAGKVLGWTDAEIEAKTADLSSVLDMDGVYTAAEYHAALAKAGMEGLGMAQGWGGGPRYSYQ